MRVMCLKEIMEVLSKSCHVLGRYKCTVLIQLNTNGLKSGSSLLKTNQRSRELLKTLVWKSH